MSKKEKLLDTHYVLYLLNRYWVLILSGIALGGAAAFCLNEFSTPLYKSQISLFTWNRNITNAIKNVTKNQENRKTSKIQEVMMHNNIISQSIYLGQRLISDYVNIINSPQIKKATDEDLIRKGFKVPLKYNFECSVKRNSCIMKINVVSPDRKLAAAAANSLVNSFKNEQERLMDVKYAQAMHPATLPILPFYPRKKINLIFGFLIGMLTAAAIAFMLDHLDVTIKNPDDLKKINLLTLGCVPYYADIDSLYNPDEQKKTQRQGNSILDAVRIISTTISFLRVDNPPKAIAFTSPHPGAGKSTEVLLLGKIMGGEHKKTLIIDCDLRKPRIYKNIALPNNIGLVNYLTDSQCNDPEKYINSKIFPDVDLMQHGIIPPNPT